MAVGGAKWTSQHNAAKFSHQQGAEWSCSAEGRDLTAENQSEGVDFFGCFSWFFFGASTSCHTSCQAPERTTDTLAYLRHTCSLPGWRPLLAEDRIRPIREQGGKGLGGEGGVAYRGAELRTQKQRGGGREGWGVKALARGPRWGHVGMGHAHGQRQDVSQ